MDLVIEECSQSSLPTPKGPYLQQGKVDELLHTLSTQMESMAESLKSMQRQKKTRNTLKSSLQAPRRKGVFIKKDTRQDKPNSSSPRRNSYQPTRRLNIQDATDNVHRSSSQNQLSFTRLNIGT